jgi:chemotaxis protein MotA
MDIAAIIGSIMGVAFILIGQAMEGGNIGQLLQITAAFIVLGGSAGAVVMSFPVNVIATAIALLKDVFGSCEVNFD